MFQLQIIATLKTIIDRLYDICRKTNARMQLINVFDINKREANEWEQRWGKIVSIFNTLKLTFIEATNREVSFVTDDLVPIDFLEVPCVASGHYFEDGNCLLDSDISVYPDMSLAICRWTDSSVDISKMKYDVDAAVAMALTNSCQKCVFGTIDNFIYTTPIKKYMALPHYKWPPVLDIARRKKFATYFLAVRSCYSTM